AVLEPQTRGLGNVLWLVDLNRQSLDRVVPVIRAAELERQFETAGWRVIELKYGQRLRQAFARDGGDILRRRIDEMPNQLYQSLFGASEEVVLETVLDGLSERERGQLARLLAGYDGAVGSLLQDLGGHDLGDVLAALESARADASRPTVVFAYTIKGYGLPIAGRPLNHSALLDAAQISDLRSEVGLEPGNEWERFESGSAEASACEQACKRLERPQQLHKGPQISVPATLSSRDPAN